MTCYGSATPHQPSVMLHGCYISSSLLSLGFNDDDANESDVNDDDDGDGDGDGDDYDDDDDDGDDER